MIRLSAFADEISRDPVEQLDVLEQHGIRHIEFRSIHGVNVLDLNDDQHAEFRALLRAGALASARSARRSARSRSPSRSNRTCNGSKRRSRWRSSTKRPAFASSAIICLQVRIQRRIGTKWCVAWPHSSNSPPGAAWRSSSKMRRASSATPPRGVLDLLNAIDSPFFGHAFDPANYLEVGQPIDEAWERLRPRVTHFHVKDYDTTLHKNVPAGEGQGQIPRLIADAVAHGYDGFCTLEPHLVVAESFYGFTGPERFGDAARALKKGLDEKGVKYA